MRNTYLQIIITIGFIFVVFSVCYYFCYSLPNQNKKSYELEQKKIEQELLLAEKKQQAELELKNEELKLKQTSEQRLQEQSETEKKTEIEKMTKLENCINDAILNYSASWSDVCKERADKYTKEWGAMCTTVQQMINNKGSIYCDEIEPLKAYNPNCKLPTSDASILNGYLENSKSDCYSMFGN